MSTQQSSGARLQVRADVETVKAVKKICIEREISVQDFVLDAVRKAMKAPAVPPRAPRGS